MLLRYVTSYVSKWQDSFHSESLYSIHVGPYQAAYKYLMCMKPLELEMWLSLSSTKMSWTPSRRKKLAFHFVESFPATERTWRTYADRPAIPTSLSFSGLGCPMPKKATSTNMAPHLLAWRWSRCSKISSSFRQFKIQTNIVYNGNPTPHCQSSFPGPSAIRSYACDDNSGCKGVQRKPFSEGDEAFSDWKCSDHFNNLIINVQIHFFCHAGTAWKFRWGSHQAAMPFTTSNFIRGRSYTKA